MTVINSIRKQNAKKNLKISKKQNKRSIWIHLKIKKVADVKFRHQKSYGMFFVSLSLPFTLRFSAKDGTRIINSKSLFVSI